MAISKKSTHRRLPHEKGPFKRVLNILLIILLCGGVLAGFWLLSKLGPKNVDYTSLKKAPVELSAEASALAKQSIELEARFEELSALREPEAEDLELLKQALEVQQQYISLLPNYDSEAEARLEGLRQRYQNLMAKVVLEESVSLAEEARGLGQAESYEAARAKMLKAYEMQKEINETYPLSDAANAGRATRLQREAKYMAAEPLYRKSLAFEQRADTLIEAREWLEAEAALRQSIELQDELNRQYRGANQARAARYERLKGKLVGIRSGQSHVEIIEMVKVADARLAEANMLEAAGIYEEVARLQLELNKAYPESPYASSDLVSEYQRRGQTAQSYQLGLEIERNDDLLRQLLAERRTYEAAEVIVALRRDIAQMKVAFPSSSLNDEQLELKIRYLNLVQNDLGFIQDHIYGQLLPIPEVTGWQMTKTEISQALYQLIMGTNPSRNLGDLNPVDSVSWHEAKRFCERLTWVLGKEVRLPTENEFRAALGRLRYVALEEHAWSASDSNGIARPVGQKQPFSSGYVDLLGNVSEWLESTDRFEHEDAKHIGGHVQDRLDVIYTVPLRQTSRSDRNRMTGFRVAVAMP